MLRNYKITWMDSQGTLRERTVAVDESAASPERLREVGRRVAERSRFGVDRVLRTMPCHPGGAPRRAE